MAFSIKYRGQCSPYADWVAKGKPCDSVIISHQFFPHIHNSKSIYIPDHSIVHMDNCDDGFDGFIKVNVCDAKKSMYITNVHVHKNCTCCVNQYNVAQYVLKRLPIKLIFGHDWYVQIANDVVVQDHHDVLQNNASSIYSFDFNNCLYALYTESYEQSWTKIARYACTEKAISLFKNNLLKSTTTYMSTDDDWQVVGIYNLLASEKEVCATMIQAVYKGWMTRRQYAFNPHTTLGRFYAMKMFYEMN